VRSGERERREFDKIAICTYPPGRNLTPATRTLDEFERGDYIELTAEQLEQCAAAGESPWPDEWRC
jgi:hypothetical protein